MTSKDLPPTEVTPRAKRRSFSAQYKLRILEEADACTEPGEVGALLRREGLYSSNLTRWCRQREKGQLQGLAPSKRGRKKTQRDEIRHELEQLHQEKQQLEARLAQAETIIEVQKKLSTLLGLPPTPTQVASKKLNRISRWTRSKRPATSAGTSSRNEILFASLMKSAHSSSPRKEVQYASPTRDTVEASDDTSGALNSWSFLSEEFITIKAICYPSTELRL